jgi:hypothetical protein
VRGLFRKPSGETARSRKRDMKYRRLVRSKLHSRKSGWYLDNPYVRARHETRVTFPRRLPKRLRPRCCARTRRGSPRQCQALTNGRCKLHGGMSTGARTPEGRARIAAAARRRWAEYRRRKAIVTG